MGDIVERLRERAVIARDEGNATATSDAYHFWEAAAEIDRLRADNERLRAALTRLVAWEGPVELACPELGGLLKAMYDARAALEAKDD